jgi:SAM-dependent methyltransferase
MKEIDHFLSLLAPASVVLDFGSYDTAFAAYCRHKGLPFVIDACDVNPPSFEASKLFRTFIRAESKHPQLPIPNDTYDGILLKHVLEHLPHPIETMKEILRILKPGGYVYIETPSDRSLQTKSHAYYRKMGFFSFWDDPTHVRPWTPAALYRLILGYQCETVRSGYIGRGYDRLIYPFLWMQSIITGDHHQLTDAAWKAYKFNCFAIARKPKSMASIPEFNYITFRKPTQTPV